MTRIILITMKFEWWWMMSAERRMIILKFSSRAVLTMQFPGICSPIVERARVLAFLRTAPVVERQAAQPGAQLEPRQVRPRAAIPPAERPEAQAAARPAIPLVIQPEVVLAPHPVAAAARPAATHLPQNVMIF